jgi:hypothetical protein
MAKKPEEENVVDTIRDLKHRDPFTPFRVVMTSGESHTVEDPDLLAMNESQLVYCFPRSSRVLYLRVNQIATVDDTGLQVRSGGRTRRH